MGHRCLLQRFESALDVKRLGNRGQLCESRRDNAPLDTRSIPKAPHSAFAAISLLYGDVGFTKIPRVLYRSAGPGPAPGCTCSRPEVGWFGVGFGQGQRPSRQRNARQSEQHHRPPDPVQPRAHSNTSLHMSKFCVNTHKFCLLVAIFQPQGGRGLHTHAPYEHTAEGTICFRLHTENISCIC